MKSAWVASALLAAGCGPPGRLTGTVTLALGDVSMAMVSVTGPAVATAAVGPDGTYELDGLPNGTYLVEARAPWTLEAEAVGKATVSGGTGRAPPLRLTGVGQVVGRVAGAADVTGAEVFATETPAVQRVGADGFFTLLVPAGARTVSAVLPGYAPTSQGVSVSYATQTPDVTLTLSAPSAATGSLEGHAYYFDRTDHSGIQVAAAGTAASVTTVKDGSYVLTGVPDGPTTLVFSAPGYAAVTVEVAVPGVAAPATVADVRLYLAQSRFLGQVYGDLLYPAPDGSGALFVGMAASDPGTPWLYYVPLNTSGAAARLQRLLSPSDLWVAWQADGALAAVSPTTPGAPLWAVQPVAGSVVEVTPALSPGEPQPFDLMGGRVFFLDQAPDRAARLGAFDVASGTTVTLEEVAVAPLAGECTGPAWAPETWHSERWVQFSPGGKAAYFTAPTTSTPNQIHVVDHGMIRSVAAQVSCFRFLGETLVGATLGPTTAVLALDPGPAVTLLSVLPSGALGGFTGDGRYAWMESAYEAYSLTVSPVPGGTVAQMFSSAVPLTVLAQPGGDLLAVYAPFENPLLMVTSPTGATLATIDSSNPHAAQAGVFFSPLGSWLFAAVTPDGLLWVADTATLTRRPLSGTPVSTDAFILASTFTRFSPAESALAYSAVVDGGCLNQLVQIDAGVLASSGWGCPSVDDWIAFDPSNRWALLHGGTDGLVDLVSGASVDLGVATLPLDGQPAFFTGTGGRVAFRETASRPTRVFTVNPGTHASRYVADDDGAWIGAVAGSSSLILIEDAARVPPGGALFQPAGLYVLDPP